MAQGTKGTARRRIEPTEETTGPLRPPVSPAEAGKMLGLSRWTMDKLIERGDIRTVRIGDRRKIRRSEIDRYIVEQERRAELERRRVS